MSQYQIVPSARFREDLKRASRGGHRMPQILRAIRLLAEGVTIETEYRDRAMFGKYSKYRECRVEPGCVLVYRYSGNKLILYFLKLSGTWRNALMFTRIEVKYQLFRNKGRSALLVLAAALLCGCMMFYMANIDASQKALDALNESTPARIKLTNLLMDSFDRLRIRSGEHDLLADCGLKDILTTSRGSGCYQTEPDAIFYEGLDLYTNPGDTAVLGLSRLAAAGAARPEHIVFEKGADASLFEGEEGLCLISEKFAENSGVSMGDTISMELFQLIVDRYGVDTYQPISGDTPGEKAQLRVVGIMKTDAKPEQQADVYVPVNWMRRLAEKNGRDFYYTSFSASLIDSMKLNEFKEKAQELLYHQPLVMERSFSSGATDLDRGGGTTLFMEDQDFIRAAEKLGGAVQTYRAFMPPFFALIILLITLAVFLILRSARGDMAVSCSLGCPKRKIACIHLTAALSAQLLGCILVLPATLLLTGIGTLTALQLMGGFLLCALVGDCIGLAALLRFDAMSLLLKAE